MQRTKEEIKPVSHQKQHKTKHNVLTSLKCWKENNNNNNKTCESKVLYAIKISIKTESKIKTFSYTQNEENVSPTKLCYRHIATKWKLKCILFEEHKKFKYVSKLKIYLITFTFLYKIIHNLKKFNKVF